MIKRHQDTTGKMIDCLTSQERHNLDTNNSKYFGQNHHKKIQQKNSLNTLERNIQDSDEDAIQLNTDIYH